MASHRLLSLYDLHPDGSGCCLSSWRRPVLNMRPGYHLPLIRGPHQFSADLELLHWLEHRQIEVDVLTDDDLHTRGAAALSPYRVVLTGSHPEYYSAQMLDGLDGYLAAGGRLMYLGGNGFYWVTTAPAGRPVPHRSAAGTGRDQGVGIGARRMAPGHDRGARRAVAAPGPFPAVPGRGGVHRAGIRRVPALPHRGRPRAGAGQLHPRRHRPGRAAGRQRLGPRRAGGIRDRPGRPGSGHPGGRGGRSRPRASSATPTRARWRM